MYEIWTGNDVQFPIIHHVSCGRTETPSVRATFRAATSRRPSLGASSRDSRKILQGPVISAQCCLTKLDKCHSDSIKILYFEPFESIWAFIEFFFFPTCCTHFADIAGLLRLRLGCSHAFSHQLIHVSGPKETDMRRSGSSPITLTTRYLICATISRHFMFL